MKLTPPKSFSVPEGTKVGDYFKCLDEWKLLKNGDVELCSLDGESVEKPSAEDNMKGMSVPDRASYQMAQIQQNQPAPKGGGY